MLKAVVLVSELNMVAVSVVLVSENLHKRHPISRESGSRSKHDEASG